MLSLTNFSPAAAIVVCSNKVDSAVTIVSSFNSQRIRTSSFECSMYPTDSSSSSWMVRQRKTSTVMSLGVSHESQGTSTRYLIQFTVFLFVHVILANLYVVIRTK